MFFSNQYLGDHKLFNRILNNDNNVFFVFTANMQKPKIVIIVYSLGAQVDGVSNVCSGNDAYIMSSLTFPQKDPNKASNRWKFSTCSTDYFTSRIDTLES